MTRRKETPKPCPHCGRLFRASPLAQHERVCYKNPTVRERVRVGLTSDVPGRGLTFTEYCERARADYTLADPGSLRRQTGARSWAALLAEFGLAAPEEHRSPMRTCPTCGQTFKALGYAHHAAKCGGSAQMQAIVQEVAEESALLELEGALLAQDAEAAFSLFVGDDDPHKPNYKPPIVRDLPGVTVNGRACVAMMLR